jgi:phage portal protein BeeE
VASLLRRIASRGERNLGITDLDSYVQALNQFTFNGNVYGLGGITQSYPGEKVERIPNSLEGYAQSVYAGNGIVFACMAVRQLVFSAVRFQYQRMNRGRPGDLWGDGSLALLEEPTPGETTQDLLARMIQDADLAGNFYAVVDTPLPRLGSADREIVRLRPDWVEIALEERRIEGQLVGYRRIGYAYYEGGRYSGVKPAVFLPEEVAHFAPYPDPLATFRGMSWLTPVIREIQNDGMMTRHKIRFFEQGATPNLVVKGIPAQTKAQFDELVEMMDSRHSGPENAGRTLYLTAGADATVVGSNFQQLDLKAVQGYGETRIAAAAGVSPVIVGLSEGLAGSSLNAGNYGQARRRFADGTMHPLWQNAAGSMQRIVKPQPGSRLWYDSRDVPFLREDEKDAAEILQTLATTMRQWIDAGYTPDSVKACMQAGGDLSLLEHSGLFSVQLQAPGQGSTPVNQPSTGSADDG